MWRRDSWGVEVKGTGGLTGSRGQLRFSSAPPPPHCPLPRCQHLDCLGRCDRQPLTSGRPLPGSQVLPPPVLGLSPPHLPLDPGLALLVLGVGFAPSPFGPAHRLHSGGLHRAETSRLPSGVELLQLSSRTDLCGPLCARSVSWLHPELCSPSSSDGQVRCLHRVPGPQESRTGLCRRSLRVADA